MFYILKNSKTPVTEAFGSNSQKVGLRQLQGMVPSPLPKKNKATADVSVEK
jgi:hypothetical protein